MKLFKNIIKSAVLLGVLMCGGCKGYLDIYDPSPARIDLYNTKEGQQKLIINLYGRYRAVFTNYQLQCYGTDMYTGCEEGPQVAQFNGYSNDMSGLSPLIGGYWEVLYKIVQESNILLNRCTPEVAGGDYDKMTAEGRFMRAMAYYYLVETFGPVPLFTKENTSPSNIITEVTREPESKIYEFIVGELDQIVDKLPDNATEAGALSNMAIKHFYGKVLLTRAYRDYAVATDADDAISYFEDVMASTKYKLLPLFVDVFNEDNQGNDEVIWSIQYGTDKNFNGGGNPAHALFGFNITALYSGFALNQKDYPAMQREIWTNPLVHEWFRHPEIDSRYDATFKREFYYNDPTKPDTYGKLGIYMPRWNDTSNDKKDEAAYFYPFKNAAGEYTWYPALSLMKWTTDCMPMCQKFKLTKIDWGGKGTREDVVIRMADTYLLCAEAYLLNDNATKARELVNAILKRAAVTDENYDVMKIDDDSQMTLDRLLEERGCEMFGEHDRWLDLKRTGTLLDRATLNPLVKYYNNLSEKHLVRPIPYNERIKVKGLTQNDGYKN